MAPTIVYDGVESAEAGTLFQDIKFWVALRIPIRRDIISKIQQNGGKIVPLEKNADILIADHVRKDAPPNSISWKFIEDSVKSGELQDQDPYRIRRATHEPRNTESSTPKKISRTPFTFDDDVILVKWVVSRDSRSGNEIYKELEGQNPRHTWMSWRDRWVKRLSQLSEPELSAIAGHETQPYNPRASPARSPGPPERQSRSRTEFSNEDDAILSQFVLDAEREGFGMTVKVFRMIAEMHPHHTWDSWKSRWRRTFPQNAKTTAARTESDQQPEDSRSPTRSHKLSTDRDTPRQTRLVPKEEQPTNSSRGRIERNPNPTEDELPEDKAVRDQFYSDFTSYVEASGVHVDMSPTVDHRVVDLFHLFDAVKNQALATGADRPLMSEEIDWKLVSQSLGFHLSQSPNVPGKLQRCYDINLSLFVSLMDGFTRVEVEKEVRDSEAEADVEIRQHDETRFALLSSLPVAAGSRKRPIDSFHQDTDSVYPPSRGSKRRRLSRDGEIPSTPDEKLGISRPSHVLNGSPSLSARRPQISPDSNAQSRERQGTAVISDKRLEPETQDFGFEPEDPLEQDSQQWDITPSQQLHAEEEASPIPCRLSANTPKVTSVQGGSGLAGLPAVNFGSATLTRRNPLSPKSGKPLDARSVDPVRDSRQTKEPDLQPDDRNQSSEDDNAAEIDAEIERWESMGYPRKDVVTALLATTMAPGLAGVVMQSIRQKQGIPSGHRGIWTPQDDNAVRYVDSVPKHEDETSLTKEDEDRVRKAEHKWTRLVRKHGLTLVEQRREFLKYSDELTLSLR